MSTKVLPRIRMGWFLPLFFLLLGYLLSATVGHYRFDAILVFLILFTGFCFGQFAKEREKVSSLALAVVSVISCARLWHRPLMLYGQTGWAASCLNIFLVISLLAALLAAVPLVAPWQKGKKLSSFLSVGLFFLGSAYFLVPIISPHPLIDVFTVLDSAVGHFISGRNPYTQIYEDIYHGATGYPAAFIYWPGAVVLMAPFKLAHLDIRYALVVAQLLTAWLLYALSRHVGREKQTALWMAMLWLSFPVGPLVVEESWVDPFLCLGASALILSLLKKHWYRGGIALGLLLTVKQYGVLVIPLTLFWLYQRGEIKGLLKLCAAAALVFFAVLLPFAAADLPAFYENTFMQLVSHQFRSDSFSLVALLDNRWQVQLSQILVLGGYAITLALVVWGMRSRKPTLTTWSGGMVILLGVVFLFGKQAFANYYYFLAIFLAIHLIGSKEEVAPALVT